MVQGGSSITQQMVKLTLLSQAKTEKERKAAIQDTFARKVRELRYAIAFEQEHSKDWILERYLNIAYFGDGVYGIQAAARHYFSKDARKLNLARVGHAGRPGARTPSASTRPSTPTVPCPAATWCWTGWPQLNVITAAAGRQDRQEGPRA